MTTSYDRIYAVVSQIPAGKVATYGQVARLAGLAGHARQVGYALHAYSGKQEIPWHRVVNAKGEVSKRATPVFEQIQREMLEEEGVKFGGNSRLSLPVYQWNTAEQIFK